MEMVSKVGKVLGTRDGDHFSHSCTGPAGHLVPHPAASWEVKERSRERKKKKERENFKTCEDMHTTFSNTKKKPCLS